MQSALRRVDFSSALLLAVVIAVAGCQHSSSAPTESSSEDVPQRLPVTIGGKVGYIDRSGKLQINPQFQSNGPFKEGLASVCVGDCDSAHLIGYRYTKNFEMEKLPQTFKFGFIDESGKMVINPAYEQVDSFSEGLAAVCSGQGCYWGADNKDKEKKWGYIDHTGAVVIAPQFETAAAFKEGLAAVSVGGKYGFIDKQGRFVVNPQYDSAWAFDHGLATVGVKEGTDPESGYKWGYIDTTGKVIWAPSN